MPVKMQTTPVVPNAVYFPQILIQTAPMNGELITSCQIAFAGALVDEKGTWTPSGHSGMVYLPNMLNLEPDLADLQPVVNEIYAGIVKVVGRMNEIRKVL
jgi:hypothetical protein